MRSALSSPQEGSISWSSDERAWPEVQVLRWIGPIAVIAALAGIAVIQLHPVMDRSMLERGALSVILSYQRALPLLGLGCALATVRSREAALGAILAVVGLWLGFAFRDSLINSVVSGSATTGRLGLPGPVSCLFVGLVLAAPLRLRTWLLPPTAILVGAMLAIGIKLVDPSFHDPNFLRGGVAAGVWLVGAVGLTVHLCYRPWLGIGMRILGSWLVAIGLMLAASMLVPRPAIGSLPQPEPAGGLERPGSLDLFPDSPAAGDRKSRPAQPGPDPLLQ